MAEITREKAMDMAVKYLSFKSRTSSEMVEYLKKKNVDDNIITDVMKKLGEYRYIDDVVYLKNYVENNRHLNYYGSRRMTQDLKKRGISDDLLLSLEDLFSKEDEYQCCQMVAKKNLRVLKGQTSVQKKKKLYDKLGRMGYPTEMVLEIIRSLVLEDEPLELSEDELVFEKKKLSEKFDRDYEKYRRTHSNKGAVGKELVFKIKKSLMGRGYSYALINEKLEAKREELGDE
ncbi:RecX family transcriptional regulator [Acetobacterium malicum]|uniref:RecX family transcriptional regulator n=1 Tax=Acetobacterium malicum TaxID=52692 RepID=UPI0003F90E7F|nr:RecX family transcriptional regulator [Acetobacterium dehalogenans]